MRVLTALLILAQATHAHPSGELRGEELMRALQSGGYTILVRHARTDRTIPTKEVPGQPTPPLRADQRNLTADGERDVRLMHGVVEKYKLPIGEVISSPVYRCRETADAFGAPSITMTLRTFPTTAETQALVAAAPKPGTNRVLVTHHFVIEGTVPGITPGDVGESEAAVVKPAGDGKVTLVGKIKLADWQSLGGGQAILPVQPEKKVVTIHGQPAVPVLQKDIPTTPTGKLATRYIEAFNSGDQAKMRAYIESSMLSLPDRPIETRLQTYAQLFEQHGALTLNGVMSATDDAVALQMKSKRGDIIVTVTASADQPGRTKSVTFGIPGGHP
ncbi:MAG TPA: histidine phosphatase family protein [Thermoanaerobaculia bacterium]|nr:histidine phosphatase family protein [Thermoanaerobaculia bacterium]